MIARGMDKSKRGTWVGVDVGGTFTDAVLYDSATGTLSWSKTPSTPANPQEGLINALKGFPGVELKTFTHIVHGITIGTNAIIERRGADTWVVTTKGFKDTLEIARTERRELYNIKTLKPASLVKRSSILEIDERCSFDGTVLIPLNEVELSTTISQLKAGSPGAVAVCFLHSYANDRHEQEVARAVQAAMPGCFVCSSSDVLPVLREYERFSTTVLNAYIGPLMRDYLDGLTQQLGASGFAGALFLMTSSGGIVGAGRARRFPVHTVLSGPAGGVAAAVALGERISESNVITCDMGGTSTDVCLIENMSPPLTSDQQVSGLPNRSPQLAISTLGAGGGSISWLGDGGILEVGPRSAGAVPGPVAYDQGGTELTVTDANLCLGRLDSAVPLASGLGLNADLAHKAMKKLAMQVGGVSMEQLAEGIVRIAVAKMVSAIKEISISNGHDPRDFTLIAYGGAGPMHAAFIADELEISKVIIPVSPGHFSAFGCLSSDLRQTHVRSCRFKVVDDEWSQIESLSAALEAQAINSIGSDGLSTDQLRIEREFGLRYVGQSWELDVSVPHNVKSAEALSDAFELAYRQRYQHVHKLSVECVSIRVTVIGPVQAPIIGSDFERANACEVTHRSVYFGSGFHDTPVYIRASLPNSVRGPALIEESGALTVVPPGWRVSIGGESELRLEKND